MSALDRRSFLRSATAALPVVALPACTGEGADASRTSSPRTLDPALLRAVAEVTLPPELGAPARELAVSDFERWLAEYTPVAERDHGYGTGELSYTGPDPAPGWKAQLEALDLEARQRFARGLPEIEPAMRDRMVRTALRRERGPVPSPAEAQHVVLGLLGWWLASAQATDLCYRARIGKETCRPLEQTGDEPPPLGNGA
jgi:hypothetical protein